MASADLNVDNYNVSELLSIVELDSDASETDIVDKTNKMIARFENSSNKNMAVFFQNVQDKLLYELYDDGPEEDDDEEEDDDGRNVGEEDDGQDGVGVGGEQDDDIQQVDEWYQNEVLTPKNNPIQKDKITERKQKVEVFDNHHMPMNRTQLGVNNNFNVPVAQDVLNPNLENTTTRFINLDSQFRQSSDTLSTDYTLDLSDPLTNALSLRLYSIQIPYTWYVIDEQYGNTCFWIVIPYNGKEYEVPIYFTSGNYTYPAFQIEFENAIIKASINYTGIPPSIPLIRINANNSKVTINLNGWQYNDPIDGPIPIIGITENSGTFNPLENPYFVFFDFSGRRKCLSHCKSKTTTINGTLGWLMGFRLPIVPIFSSPGNKPVSIIDLYGPKYFILVLDDFNQNHINNGLITITEISKKLDMPAYYNTTMPYICVSNSPNPLINALNNLSGIEAAAFGINDANAGNYIDKLDTGYGQRPVILPSAPRTLTNAQIYTINEITKNREQNTSYRGKAPTNTDTFAIIPIKRAGMATGDLYVDFSGSMQDNKRVYFGPVSIDRMRVKLIDDRGYTVDLHGAEWCFTMISEILYQY